AEPQLNEEVMPGPGQKYVPDELVSTRSVLPSALASAAIGWYVAFMLLGAPVIDVQLLALAKPGAAQYRAPVAVSTIMSSLPSPLKSPMTTAPSSFQLVDVAINELHEN